MTGLEKLLKWIDDYYKVNGTPNLSEIKAQIGMLIDEEKTNLVWSVVYQPNDNKYRHLTKGKAYRVVASNNETLAIINDIGKLTFYAVTLFRDYEHNNNNMSTTILNPSQLHQINVSSYQELSNLTFTNLQILLKQRQRVARSLLMFQGSIENYKVRIEVYNYITNQIQDLLNLKLIEYEKQRTNNKTEK